MALLGCDSSATRHEVAKFDGATFYRLTDGQSDGCEQPDVLGGASFGWDDPDLSPLDTRTRETHSLP